MKKYQIVYADPPWECSNQNVSQKSYVFTDRVGSHYQVMPLKDICSLPISNITDDNCLLFLWARSPAIPEALKVGESWGFKYSTVGFVWDKQRIIPSYYTPSQIELCLIFKKNKIPQPIASTKEHQFLSEKRTAHSKKPDEIRNRITRMFPTQNKIELFARQKVEGWDCWGNEVESDIEL